MTPRSRALDWSLLRRAEVPPQKPQDRADYPRHEETGGPLHVIRDRRLPDIQTPEGVCRPAWTVSDRSEEDVKWEDRGRWCLRAMGYLCEGSSTDMRPGQTYFGWWFGSSEVYLYRSRP